MPGMAAKIKMTEKQQVVLDELCCSRTASRAIVQRASIVVLGFQGLQNEQIARRVGLNAHQVGVWRRRWRDSWEKLCVWECTEPRRLREAILEVFKDAPGRGAPGKFTAEQVSLIVALACEKPELSGRPITRWTHRELRDEIIKRKIVPSISVTHVGRLLKQAATQPHRTQIWLNTKEKDPVAFRKAVKNVCQTYLDASRKAAEGTHTVSVDEKTSIQALERTKPEKPTQPGRVAKQEQEYKRHGTTTLTASLDVVTGKILSPTLEPTRTEPQFVQHIARTVASNPAAGWVIVVDRLNTHASEGLVKWVAEQCGLTEDLGKKVSGGF